MTGKKRTLARNEELEMKGLAVHHFDTPRVSVCLHRNDSLTIKLQLTITNYRTLLPPKELEMTENTRVNVYIITDSVITEHVAQSACFGIAPIHHKVDFSLTRNEIIGDFLQKVDQVFYLRGPSILDRLNKSTKNPLWR